MECPNRWTRVTLIPMLLLIGWSGCTDPGKPLTAGVPTVTNAASSAPQVTFQDARKDVAGSAEIAEPIGAESRQETGEPISVSRRPEPIYDSSTPGRLLIANAVKQAQRDHKRVLIEWGFNTCGWCVRLHDTFKNDPLVQPLIAEKFVLVLVDSTANGALLREYGGRDRQYSFPHLTILDDQGKVLTNQNTEPLEKGSAHDPMVVAQFLMKWSAPKAAGSD